MGAVTFHLFAHVGPVDEKISKKFNVVFNDVLIFTKESLATEKELLTENVLPTKYTYYALDYSLDKYFSSFK